MADVSTREGGMEKPSEIIVANKQFLVHGVRAKLSRRIATGDASEVDRYARGHRTELCRAQMRLTWRRIAIWLVVVTYR
jgi:hypothetical protein